MGNPGKAYDGTIHYGTAEGTPGDSATLDEALASAAEKLVRDGIVTADAEMTFDVVHLQVVIANQHVRQYTVGLIPTSGGGGS